LLILLVMFAAVGVTVVWARSELFPGAGGEAVTFQVEEGWGSNKVASELAAAGVTGNARLVQMYLKATGAPQFQAGTYELKRDMDVNRAVDVLEAGPAASFQQLTIPEGLTVTQIAAKVAQLPGKDGSKFVAAAQSGQFTSKFSPAGSTSLEGLLFPDTYQTEQTQDEAAILQLLIAQFDKVATEAQIETKVAQLQPPVTPYEAIIVASLIEREARVDEDRPKIARVIYNRLKKGTVLNIDAAVLYGLGKTSGSLTQSELNQETPYNTYLRVGLPPTPIASPGRASIEAALNPTPGDWEFYVIADAEGHHDFSVTYDEHLAKVEKARKAGLL
jgi:UPF0755 protein